MGMTSWEEKAYYRRELYPRRYMLWNGLYICYMTTSGSKLHPLSGLLGLGEAQQAGWSPQFLSVWAVGIGWLSPIPPFERHHGHLFRARLHLLKTYSSTGPHIIATFDHNSVVIWLREEEDSDVCPF